MLRTNASSCVYCFDFFFTMTRNVTICRKCRCETPLTTNVTNKCATSLVYVCRNNRFDTSITINVSGPSAFCKQMSIELRNAYCNIGELWTCVGIRHLWKDDFFLRKCGRFTITDQTKSRWLIFQQLKIDYKEKST